MTEIKIWAYGTILSTLALLLVMGCQEPSRTSTTTVVGCDSCLVVEDVESDESITVQDNDDREGPPETQIEL